MIEEKVRNIHERIASACRRVGSDPADIRLLAVTKSASADKIREAVKAGINAIGENKIQESLAKFKTLDLKGVEKHLIGHLQTNKVKKAVEIFDVIQSLDRFEVAREINARAAELGKVQECFLEIKVSPEDTKFGMSPENVENFFNTVLVLKHINITGLMAMAPYFEDPEQARPYFRTAKEVFYSLKDKGLSTLSMGMSGDFEVAIEEGANMIRVGTAIFK